MAAYDSLTRYQRKAIPALLASKTIAEAAAKSGLSERTLYRYLRDDAFRAALGQAEADAINFAARRLIAEGGDALDVLSNLMKGAKSESVKRLAASDWISNILKWQELAILAARVSDLEEHIHEVRR